MEEEKPEKMSNNPSKKENDNKKKWMKRIWVHLINEVLLTNNDQNKMQLQMISYLYI